ncbi:flagellar biosynthesis protein FlgJ [Azospirillum sp. TSO22-1]|nr:flagellar biosynthesis protein FlgJ [Azospirillum sp. TSO22-1]
MTGVSPATTDRRPAVKPAGDAGHAATEFEAMMVGQMLQSMFEGVRTGGAFGGGDAERTWRGFMLQEYGRAIAEAGTLGIGRMVHAEVARLYGDGDAGGRP